MILVWGHNCLLLLHFIILPSINVARLLIITTSSTTEASVVTMCAMIYISGRVNATAWSRASIGGHLIICGLWVHFSGILIHVGSTEVSTKVILIVKMM